MDDERVSIPIRFSDIVSVDTSTEESETDDGYQLQHYIITVSCTQRDYVLVFESPPPRDAWADAFRQAFIAGRRGALHEANTPPPTLKRPPLQMNYPRSNTLPVASLSRKPNNQLHHQTHHMQQKSTTTLPPRTSSLHTPIPITDAPPPTASPPPPYPKLTPAFPTLHPRTPLLDGSSFQGAGSPSRHSPMPKSAPRSPAVELVRTLLPSSDIKNSAKSTPHRSPPPPESVKPLLSSGGVSSAHLPTPPPYDQEEDSLGGAEGKGAKVVPISDTRKSSATSISGSAKVESTVEGDTNGDMDGDSVSHPAPNPLAHQILAVQVSHRQVKEAEPPMNTNPFEPSPTVQPTPDLLVSEGETAKVADGGENKGNKPPMRAVSEESLGSKKKKGGARLKKKV